MFTSSGISNFRPLDGIGRNLLDIVSWKAEVFKTDITVTAISIVLLRNGKNGRVREKIVGDLQIRRQWVTC